MKEKTPIPGGSSTSSGQQSHASHHFKPSVSSGRSQSSGSRSNNYYKSTLAEQESSIENSQNQRPIGNNGNNANTSYGGQQVSKKDINATSLSKRFIHLTRRIGSGISSSSSSCKNALDKLTNSSSNSVHTRSNSSSSLSNFSAHNSGNKPPPPQSTSSSYPRQRANSYSSSSTRLNKNESSSNKHSNSRPPQQQQQQKQRKHKHYSSSNSATSGGTGYLSSSSLTTVVRRNFVGGCSDSESSYDDHLHKKIPNSGTASTTTDASSVHTNDTDNPQTYSSSSGNNSTITSRSFNNTPPYAAHSFKAGTHTFTVDTRYSLIRVIGSGAYGVVISALDNTTPNSQKKKMVAIKMVPRAFHDEIDAKRILREIKLLKHFRHENIIGILDMMPPYLARNAEDFRDVYIVSDLMETDLHRIIYSKQSLTIDHVQYFIYQILRALKYIHSANVLHRDLKPSNLLVNSNCDLKICDLGLARGVLADDDVHDTLHSMAGATGDKNINSNSGSMLLTEYVVTRWYRAPEIMLACHEYTKPIDVWSVGCIFAELLARKPYFPGEDYIDQLTIITDKLGKLPEEDLDFVTSEKARRFMRKLPDKPVVSLRRQFPGTPADALDLLGKMLQFHPKKRITVVEALRHPFLAQLHSPDDEPVADSPFDFGFEDTEDLHRVRLQELIWEEIGSFRPSCLPVACRRDGTRGGPCLKVQQQHTTKHHQHVRSSSSGSNTDGDKRLYEA